MKVWITRYALSKGIYEAEVDYSEDFPNMVTGKGMFEHYHGKDWHWDKASAVKRAETMRKNKIIALKKQIDAITAMVF